MGKKTKGKSRAPSKGIRPIWAWGLIAAAIVAVGFLFFDTAGPPPFSSAAAEPELIAQGENLFGQYCASCHGEKAIGQNTSQPMGGRNPGGSYLAPALNGAGHAWHHPPDMMFNVIRNGSRAKESPMRGVGDRLTDLEIHSVIAYIQSLWPKKLRERYRRSHAQ